MDTPPFRPLSEAQARYLLEHGGLGIAEESLTPEAAAAALEVVRQNRAAAWVEATLAFRVESGRR